MTILRGVLGGIDSYSVTNGDILNVLCHYIDLNFPGKPKYGESQLYSFLNQSLKTVYTANCPFCSASSFSIKLSQYYTEIYCDNCMKNSSLSIFQFLTKAEEDGELWCGDHRAAKELAILLAENPRKPTETKRKTGMGYRFHISPKKETQIVATQKQRAVIGNFLTT